MILTSLIVAALSLQALCPRCVAVQDHGIEVLLPNDELTPGAVDPALDREAACRPERQRKGNENARSVPASLRAAVFNAYGVPTVAFQGVLIRNPNSGSSAWWSQVFELDHRVPVKLEGLSATPNLSPQPYLPVPGAHQKDRLELEIIKRVCIARTMSLEEGQKVFLAPSIGGTFATWLDAYHTYITKGAY